MKGLMLVALLLVLPGCDSQDEHLSSSAESDVYICWKAPVSRTDGQPIAPSSRMVFTVHVGNLDAFPERSHHTQERMCVHPSEIRVKVGEYIGVTAWENGRQSEMSELMRYEEQGD